MATPRETGRPNSWKVIATDPSSAVVACGLLAFAELVVDESDDGGHRLRLVLALRLDLDLGAQACRQHHHAHDALGIDATTVPREEDLAAKAAGQLGELGRRARMQAELVTDPRGRL